MGEKDMIQADRTMHGRLFEAIDTDLVANLNRDISTFVPVAPGIPENYQIGDIEDANVLIQNSLWLNVPIGQLNQHRQVVSLQDRTQWARNQVEQIGLIREKFDRTAAAVKAICV